MLRVEANLFFGNISRFKDKVYRVLRDTPDVQCIVIDGACFTHIDTTSLHVLESMHNELESKNIMFEIVAVHGPVRDILRRSGLARKQKLDLKTQIPEAIRQIEIV